MVVDAHRHLHVIDADHRTVLADLGLPTPVRILRPSPDGLRLITIPIYTGKAAPPLLWDLERYRLVTQLEGHVGFVYTGRFLAEGRAIVTTGVDGAARLRDSETGRPRQAYRGGSRFLADATLSPDGSMLVAEVRSPTLSCSTYGCRHPAGSS